MKCSDAYLKLIMNKSFYEQSLLNRIISHKTLGEMNKFRMSVIDKFISVSGHLISTLPSDEAELVQRHQDMQSKYKYNKKIASRFNDDRKPPYKR